MNETPWVGLMATTSDEAGIEMIRRLWLGAHRVDAAVSAPRLADLLRRLGAEHSPETVHVLTHATPALDPTIRATAPSHWYLTEVSETPSPEFALFYPRGSSFPASALVFAGGAGSHGWLTYHRRPLILQRLRERFDQLSILTRSHRAVPAVREMSLFADGTRGTALAPKPEPQRVTPSQLYGSVLTAHFAAAAQDGTSDPRPDGAPTLAAHQERAFERACHILDRFGGVIIADAVGLGKTYIGLRLLESTLRSGGDGLVIAPAALRDQWTREISYLQPYSRLAGARPGPSARWDNLDLWVQETGSGRIGVLSMESLGRRTFGHAKYAGADLVLVDEAHNFRNPQTQRYRNLADLVRNANVVLMTATPINNTLLDLQHLIELFAAPGAFRHLGIHDYRALFRRAAAGDGDVRDIVSACVLRRTRRFLRAHYGDVRVHDRVTGHHKHIRFPRRRPPAAIEYDLAGTYSDLLSGLDEWLNALHFPSICMNHPDDDVDANPASIASLLKIILLKRLESSVEAFRRTVCQQLAWCKTALHAVSVGRVLTRPDYRKAFQGPADDPGSQLAFFELVLPVPTIDRQSVGDFRHQLERDAEVLSHFHAKLSSIGADEDRKFTTLLELLDNRLSGKKVLIFTEFRDTARYLHHALANRPYIAQIDSDVAHLGRDRASRRDVIERFAPRSNGLREPPDRERVDVLIATDVLSEGLNLQDASAVVSYDLPWNPVRLMQRIGRIDRLGALHEWVELHHFVPVRELDRLLGLMTRLTDKVGTIEATLGPDNPVLGEPEAVNRNIQHLRLLATDPKGYDTIEAELEGPFDPEEQAYLDYVALRGNEPPSGLGPLVTAVKDVPGRRLRAIAYWRVSCGRQTRGLWLVCDPKSGCVVEDAAAAIEALRKVSTESPTRIDRFDSTVISARQACARYARGVAERLEAARIAGDALRPGLPQCRISSWLGHALQSKRHRPGPEARSLIDRVLEKLSRRFTAADERALAQVVARLPTHPSLDFLIDLERRLLDMEPDDSGSTKIEEVGLLLFVPRV
jgi:superfamily II DNA or RNA helicase